jgi:hypothetical protein
MNETRYRGRMRAARLGHRLDVGDELIERG